MKKTLLIAASLFLLMTIAPTMKAQEVSTGLDIYSSYVWRGTKFGSGPAFQPSVEFSAGGFAIGAWGSVNSSDVEAFEADLYASYGVDLGESTSLSFTLTDYYFGGDWTEYKTMHYLEPMVSLGLGDLSLAAAYMFLPAVDEDGSFGEEGDMYFEASYGFENVSIGLGAGDGQYTSDGEFSICNINIGTSKEIKLTESFSLPVSGAVILNPSKGGFFVTVGISL